MAVDPRAVSVFVVATEEAEVHGALLANEIGRFVHEWSPSSLYMLRIYCTARASITCHPVRVRGLVSGTRL